MKKIVFRFLFLSLFIIANLKSNESPIINGDETAALLIEYQNNSLKWPLLHYAIEKEHSDIAFLALQLFPEQALQKTPDIKLLRSHLGSNASQDYDYVVGQESGISALELAIKHNNLAIAKALIRSGSDVNEIRLEHLGGFADYWEPRGMPSVKEKVKFTRSGYESFSLIYWAINGKNYEILDLLLRQGAKLHPFYERWKDGGLFSISAISAAAILGEEALLRKLIFYQKLRNDREEKISEASISSDVVACFQTYSFHPSNWPPLHYALSENDFEGFKILLDYGEDPQTLGNASKSLLDKALESDNPLFLELLVEKWGHSDAALIAAVSLGNVEKFAKLLDEYPATRELLDLAVKTNQLEIAKLLINHGIRSLNAIKKSIEDNQLEMLEALLKSHQMDEYWPEAIEQSIGHKNEKMVELLLDHHFIHPHALRLAIEGHSLPIFSLLLERGFCDEQALMIAIESNECLMFQTLFERREISGSECHLLKKRAVELSRYDILSYLLKMEI